ncbi:MAG TPA: ATP-binding protein [Candidatus Micrarchaeia archaeon]|nr:ATP-binding protein [Candidatus Micrarchaeia archaeon]
MNSSRRPEFASQIALPWIVRLRYGMVIAQITTALVAQYVLKISLPIFWILPVPLVVFGSNLWLAAQAWSRDFSDPSRTSSVVMRIFVLDIFCLTALLMLSGGAANPFSVLYLVHITLAAIILKKNQAWLLGGLSVLCFGLLFVVYRPVAELEVHVRGKGPNFHLLGMWISFSAAVLLVALFSAKIAGLLSERESSLLAMQEELAKRDRLASLVTLAAGAAHELATPLGTIAVVAKELELYATKATANGAIVDDSRLIRSEVERCRAILSRMSVRGAEPAGEPLESVPIQSLLDELRNEFSPSMESQIEFPAMTQQATVKIPRNAVVQALAALVRNALDSSEPGVPIHVGVELAGDFARFAVKDSGLGMSLETLRRVGEPFFTTKDPSKGMGLGVFLVRTLAERLGGQLTFESSEGLGTTALLDIPLALQAEWACD